MGADAVSTAQKQAQGSVILLISVQALLGA